MELTSDLALKAVIEAHRKALNLNVLPTVTVVDSAGNLLASLRADGAGFLTPETSKAKAVASAAFKRPTKDLSELQKTNPLFWNSVPTISQGKILPTTGAVPIFESNKLIGAIGVGGGSPEQDHEIALAGLSVFK